MLFSKTEEASRKIAYKVKEKGGTAYYVGGFVRDLLLGIKSDDVDIEIHGITPYELEKILDSIGERVETGKSFGIYRLCGRNLDIAMPRRETATGRGHRDFKIDVDPFIGTKKAAMRRDFTINSLMQDVLSGEIIDHFGGKEDLKKGVIRYVNEKNFSEDPLRVLRAAQFAARFDFEVEHETVELCRKVNLSSLSKERVFDELKKALLKAERPSLFFEQLRKMEQLSVWFPEIEKLSGVMQHTVYHKEGNAWTHTMMVLDEAAKRRKRAEYLLYFMLSALVHDLGKISCTSFIKGNYHAYSHEIEGIQTAKKFLHRITNENLLKSYVLNMVEHHMKPNAYAANKSSIKATNKLFDSSKSPNDLILLSVCDGQGKIPKADYRETELFLRQRLSIYREYMSRPYVSGSDLIDAGVAPGKDFSRLLDYAHKMRLAGVSKENALSQILKFL